MGQWLARYASKIPDVDELPATADEGMYVGAIADFGFYRIRPDASFGLAASGDLD